MKPYYILALGILIATSSCSEDEPKPMLPKRGEVNLTTPLSRQKTMYQRFTNSCPGGNFDTDTDTIVLEVILEDGKKFFDEYGTPGSMSSEVRNHSIRMPVAPEVGVLRISGQDASFLFSSFTNDEVRVDSSFSEVLRQEACAILTQPGGSVFDGELPGQIIALALDTIQLFGLKYMVAGPQIAGIENTYALYDGRHMYLSYDEIIDPAQVNRMIGWVRIEP